MTTISAHRRELVASLSSAGFAVRTFGLHTVTGTVPITAAWVDQDDAGTPTAVHATLDLGSLDTGNARRDHDLRMPSLLDLDRYPTLRFSGRPKRSDGGWTVQGTVRAHGASAPITLHASLADDPDGCTTVHAHGELDRRDLGVSAPRLMIGRRITVRLDVTLGPERPRR